MPVPTAYLTSTKNLPGILAAIRGAKAPARFTTRFLEGLGFKSVSDRLVLGLLKSLGLLTDSSAPTQRYFSYLDEGLSKAVLAEAIEEAYADLFAVNAKANTLDRAAVRNKLKTLTQGQYTDSVLDKMAGTFTVLVTLADFSAARAPDHARSQQEGDAESLGAEAAAARAAKGAGSPGKSHHSLGGLVYNIQIVLPDSRDPTVYDALFRSLREHLL